MSRATCTFPKATWRQVLGLMLGAVLAGSGLAQAPGAGPAEADLLKTAAEVRHLRNHPADPGRPVRLHGVVTFTHAERRMFYLSDATGGIAVAATDPELTLPAAGEAVTLTGMTERGGLSPVVRATAIVREGKGAWPPPRQITYGQGLDGTEENQWVVIGGQLQQIEHFAGWLRLTLKTPAGDFSVSIPEPDQPPPALGALLRVRGVCSVWVLRDSGKIGGFFLFTPSLREVRPLGAADEAATTLTQVNQVQKLRSDQATAARPVQLSGTVTFAHPDQRIFYLHDATGSVQVAFNDDTLPLPPVGAAVALRGHTAVGVLSARVRADTLEVGDIQPLPAPQAVSLEQALTGSADGQWVQMRGRLRQVEAVGQWLRLTLISTAGEFTVSIPHAATTTAMVGSFLLVRGVCQPWLDERAKIGGVFLYTPTPDQIEVTEAPLADPFAAPEEAISNLQLYRTQTLQQEELLVRGVVLHFVPGRYVVVQNDTGVVRALGHGTAALSPGDRVDVVGVPGRQGTHLVLRGAQYRRTGAGPAPRPLQLSAPLKPDPALEGRLVGVTGLVVNSSWRQEDTRLFVQAGGAVVELVYPGALPESVAASWAPGSRIEATGLYGVEYDDDDQPVKVALQLRSPADVVVRQSASWWTARRALTGLGVLAVILVAGLGWVAALRAQVRRQTAVIQAQWEKAAALQARHGEIIANASDLIFTADRQGRFTSFNPAGERLTGYSQAEALQLGLRDLIAPQDADLGAALLAGAEAPGAATATRWETPFLTRDGRQVWVEISARWIREAGQPASLLGVARDVTERKQAEAEQAKLEELNRQLQKSESLGRMAGAVAHHFNNQLQAVMLSLELARNDRAPAREAAENLAIAMQSARKAAEISALLLTYVGRSHQERQPLDLAGACRQGLPPLRAALPAGVVLESNLPDPGPRVRANADQVMELFAHLVTNAWESCPDGKGCVRVAVATVAAADIPSARRFPPDFEPRHSAYACLEVADTGHGIAAAAIQQLFDPFYTSKFTGRGMGLPVALGIARAHDGAITVTSEVDRGSTFRVYLPVMPDSSPG